VSYTFIYVLTMLWLKEPDEARKDPTDYKLAYHHNLEVNAFKNKETCLAELDAFELEYRRKEGQYIVERYTRDGQYGGKTYTLRTKEKKSKFIKYYECARSNLVYPDE
jgi:hypothetical protein